MNPKKILKQLDFYGVNMLEHSQKSLSDHLIGTYQILLNWEVESYIALAGLCHSVYGTESYTKESVPLSDRDYLQALIGADAERIVYYFGCHRKDSLWKNLRNTDNFKIIDRFEEREVAISKQDLKDLVTLTLANWLEQRPRVPKQYLYLREMEFTSSGHLLPAKAFDSFMKAYKLEIYQVKDVRLNYTIGKDLKERPLDFIEFKKAVLELEEKLLVLVEAEERAKLQSTLGVLNRILGNLDESKKNLLQAEQYFDSLEDERLMKVNKIRIAQTLQFQRNHDEAEKLYSEVIKQLKKEKSDLLDFAFQHRGKNYFDQGKLSNALEDFNHALSLRKKKGDLELLKSTNYAIEVVQNKCSTH